jgi:hypothetical protein
VRRLQHRAKRQKLSAAVASRIAPPALPLESVPSREDLYDGPRARHGRALEADRVTVAIYVLVIAAGAICIAAECVRDATTILVAFSAALWVAALGLFALSYGAMLLLPRIDARRN